MEQKNNHNGSEMNVLLQNSQIFFLLFWHYCYISPVREVVIASKNLQNLHKWMKFSADIVSRIVVLLNITT